MLKENQLTNNPMSTWKSLNGYIPLKFEMDNKIGSYYCLHIKRTHYYYFKMAI